MNIKMLKAALAGLVLSVSGFANAGLITQEIEQAVDGENFQFNFDVLDYQIGTSSVLSITVVGDFAMGDGNVPQTDEFWSLFIEGSNFSDILPNTAGVYNLITTGTNTTQFSFNFSFDSTETSALLADNLLSFIVDFSDGVNFDLAGLGFPYSNQLGASGVTSSYSYTSTSVPEPSTLAIFALSIMGLASRRFNKQ
jgi:hypothetical protein